MTKLHNGHDETKKMTSGVKSDALCQILTDFKCLHPMSQKGAGGGAGGAIAPPIFWKYSTVTMTSSSLMVASQKNFVGALPAMSLW